MQLTRRSFLKQSSGAVLAAPLFVRNLISNPPSGRVRHASFGSDGMAGGDITSLLRHPNLDLLAVCDIDAAKLDRAQKRFATQKFRVYRDYRELLDKESKNLDSVNVSTPDHMHAPIAMSAMQLGLNAYVQKPLAHDVYECRKLAEYARDRKLVTQMGIQVHSAAPYRLGVAVIHAEAIGKVREVHTWSNKKWGDATPRPDRQDEIPAGLSWDLWVGVAPETRYLGGNYYHPFNWRKRLDFGTGTFGDMGCHIYDPVFEALALTSPISVRSEGPEPFRHNWASDAEIHYVFPGTRYTEGTTVRVVWYDGDKRPPKEIQGQIGTQRLPDQGSIFVGTKGTMLLPHVAGPILFPTEAFKDYAMPKVEAADHYLQYVNAIRGEGRTSAGFSYSGPLTEAVLLGGVATHFPKRVLEWDTAKLTFKQFAEADRLVRRTYRKGWEVKGLS